MVPLQAPTHGVMVVPFSVKDEKVGCGNILLVLLNSLSETKSVPVINEDGGATVRQSSSSSVVPSCSHIYEGNVFFIISVSLLVRVYLVIDYGYWLWITKKCYKSNQK